MELSDSHMHTELCGHAQGHPVEYVEMAARLGLTRVTITCHMPLEIPAFGGPRIRMPLERYPEYLELIEAARFRGDEVGVEVLKGIEAEVFPDAPVQKRIGLWLKEQSFDFVLGSLHHHTDAYQSWLRDHGKFSDDDKIKTYFADIADGDRTGLFDSMSHPDVIRIYGTLEGAFMPELYETEIRAAIAAAVEQDICWEVNTSGLLKGDYLAHPDPLILKWGCEMGLKLTMGSDAHLPRSVGHAFRRMISELNQIGFKTIHYFRGRERIEVPIEIGL